VSPDPEGNTPPTISILVPPADVTGLEESESIELSAVATDLESGDLSTLIAWSSSADGPLGTGRSIVVRLSVGDHVVEARVRDGSQQEAISTRTVSVVGVPWKSVSAGSGHTCGTTDDLRGYCWGENLAGELGNGESGLGMGRRQPVAPLGGYAFAAITAGNDFTCGLTPSSQLLCWGSNLDGILGDGTQPDRSIPDSLAGGLRYSAVEPGVAHACALDLDGRALCWGNNSDARLGVGASPNRVTRPTYVTGDLHFERVSAGAGHACAILRSSHQAYCRIAPCAGDRWGP
jgi:hypothetical protein